MPDMMGRGITVPLAVADGGTGATTSAAARTSLGFVGTGGWPTGIFGSGFDGAIDLNGTNTYPVFLSKSGNTYTMTRNIWATDVTVRAGCTLVKRFELYCTGTLTIEATGVVHDDGNSASGTTAGAQLGPTGRLPESIGYAGAAGRNTTGNGAGGDNANDAYGGIGGGGGASGGGASGGLGGVVNAPTAGSNQLRDGLSLFGLGLLQSGTAFVRASGGSGGGAGGCTVGTGTAVSGGGGGGAPVSMIAARAIVNSGVIRANGGAGGNASATGNGQAGGGGGGGGGYLIILSNTPQVSAGTLQVNGGAGGSGAGGGATGTTGGPGTIDYRGP